MEIKEGGCLTRGLILGRLSPFYEDPFTGERAESLFFLMVFRVLPSG